MGVILLPLGALVFLAPVIEIISVITPVLKRFMEFFGLIEPNENDDVAETQ